MGIIGLGNGCRQVITWTTFDVLLIALFRKYRWTFWIIDQNLQFVLKINLSRRQGTFGPFVQELVCQ